MAEIDYDDYHEQTAPPGAVQSVVTWAGALTSVGLVIGLAVWGYQLTMRDVSGVPVVRALEGPMRVLPDDPGGRQADHQGLAVNQVTAEGEAADPADRLLLAPRPVDLTSDDAPRASLRPQPRIEEVSATAPEALPQAPIVAPDAVAAALALVDEISAGAEPFTPASPVTETAPTVETAALAPETQVPAPVIAPGLTRSPHPAPRPDVDLSARVATPAPPASEVDATSVPPGTNLVQLGAYDSPEVARAEWQRLSEQFGSLMEGKQRLVQSAVSGGRTFYRLRAVGFIDLSDARRFCAALTAEKADCIPVISR